MTAAVRPGRRDPVILRPMQVVAQRTTISTRALRLPAALMLGAGVARGFMAHPPGVPCPLRTLTGIPCPLCGMTTSVTASTHFHLGAALAANPAGLAATVIAAALLVVRGERQVELRSWIVPVALAAMWLFELFRFNIL